MKRSVAATALVRSVVATAALLASACSNPAAPSASVRFTLDAPLCSSVIPVRLLIDAQEVGFDTLYVHVPAQVHITTAAFSTTVGHHVLGARTSFGYVFPDRAVDLVNGQVVTDSLPFYCS